MESFCVTTSELDQAAQASACDTQTGALARSGHFERISRTIEHGILVFVVLVTLLSNYATHSHLMREVLIF